MKINFDKIMSEDSMDSILSPKEIFKVLPEKDVTYKYLRDVQDQVLTEWFEKKSEKDIIIKMNTGSGKTVVGLLMLKSSLNEGYGPAVYVVPDPFLVEQVINEANQLGIAVTNDEKSLEFKRGRAILVININKLVNGKSVFGMRESKNIPIGSIIVDDVHACIATTENQFTINILRADDKYFKILSLFEEDLKKQSDSKLLEIKDGDEYKNMLIPYWAWIDKNEKVVKILHEGRNDDDIKYNWPLIKECLTLCNCVISKEKVEISPKSIPIHQIGSFVEAKRRIFMSATLNDDTPLVTHFDVDPNIIQRNQITPKTADDLGDRLIIVPEAINPKISEDELKIELKKLSLKYNVVVIVPSYYRAKYWEDIADRVHHSKTINNGVSELRNAHVGLVVFINRYDGIDLPEDACRVLVIDGLPDVKKEFDKIEEGALQGSERIKNQQIQKIEQGMGRGIRSNTDYCVVFLIGKTLTNVLYAENAIEQFSAATKTQIKLSEKLCEQVKGASLKDVLSVLNYSFDRNKDWVSASRSALVRVSYDEPKLINTITDGYRKAFNCCEIREYQQAIDIFMELINNEKQHLMKGWLMQQLAEITHFIDPVESQKILKSALKENIQVIKPIEGIQFDKKLKKIENQGQMFINNMSNINENAFILKINSLIEQLKFEPNSSNKFEETIKEIASCIGMTAYRPENDYGKGPDVLWQIGNLDFLVIECKNGVENHIICKHDCNQLNGSIKWFENTYDEFSCKKTPIMIHLGNVFEYASSPDKNIRIINRENLEYFKNNILSFANSVVHNGNFKNVQKVSELLNINKLSSKDIVKEYTIGFKIKNSNS